MHGSHGRPFRLFGDLALLCEVNAAKGQSVDLTLLKVVLPTSVSFSMKAARRGLVRR
jgi:hypothetical protein